MDFRAWTKDRATGVVTIVYKPTALAAKRAYLAMTRKDDNWSEAGWETRPNWEFSRGDAGEVWAA